MNDIHNLRNALFEQLNELKSMSEKPKEEQLLILERAKGINDVSKTILDSVKIEHNFQRMMMVAVPYSDFIPFRRDQAVDVYAKLAREFNQRWKENNAERIQEAKQQQFLSQ